MCIRDSPKLAQAQTVMLYYGVGHEIRTEGLIQTLLDQGKTVCLPKCLPENQMEARVITSLEDLAPDVYKRQGQSRHRQLPLCRGAGEEDSH